MDAGKPHQELHCNGGRHLVMRWQSCTVNHVGHILRQKLIMVSEQVCQTVTVDERLLDHEGIVRGGSLSQGLGPNVGLMLTEIVQGRGDKCDVRQMENIDVGHPIAAQPQMGRHPTRTFEDFTSPEHRTRVTDCAVPEHVFLALIVARVDVVFAPV